jgi:hypothetical protein
MDLNTASVPAMAKLVGLTVAYDLMLWRPYLSWDEVTCVPGLDGTRVAALKAAGAQLKRPGDPRTRKDERDRTDHYFG